MINESYNWLDKLYPSDNWDKLPFHEVKRQFNHNLAIASLYVDRFERSNQFLQSKRDMSFLNP